MSKRGGRPPPACTGPCSTPARSQPACAAAYPNLKEEFTATVSRLNQTPLVATANNAQGQPVQVNIDGYTLAWLVSGQSYSGPSGFATIPSMIHAAANGDGSKAAAARVARIVPPGLLGYGLAFGAYCREMASWTSEDEVLAAGKAVLPGFPDEVLRTVMVSGRVFSECAVWNVGSATAAERAPVESDVPSLLMGGTFDAVTPARWAEVVAKGLRNSEVIPIPGAGHSVITQSTCARSTDARVLQRSDPSRRPLVHKRHHDTAVYDVLIALFETS